MISVLGTENGNEDNPEKFPFSVPKMEMKKKLNHFLFRCREWSDENPTLIFPITELKCNTRK
jgi:hypothetical protein